MKHKVSVLIPCYNVSYFLPTHIDYVLNQTLRDIEVILVNDGSTDNTGEICDALAKKDFRIQVIHKANGGVGTARNTALKAATGEYIYYFDIDDKIELDLLERIVSLADKNNTDIVIFGMDVYDLKANTCDCIRFPDLMLSSNDALKKIFTKEVFFKKHGNGFLWNKLYKNSFIKENDFNFGEERVQEDEPFNLRLYLRVSKVLLTSQMGYYYYINPATSTGAKYIDNKFQSVVSVFESLKSFYLEWNLIDNKFIDNIYIRHRYAILNVVTHNYLHTNCPLTIKERNRRILEICENNSFKECCNYLQQDKLGSKYELYLWKCLKEKKINRLTILIRLNKIIRAVFIPLKNRCKFLNIK